MTDRPATEGARTADRWIRPPEQPTRYGAFARLSDMAHGWLDGKRGIPRLPEIKPVNEISVSVPESYAKPLPAPAAESESGTRPDWLTPRMNVLSKRALEQIRDEQIAYRRDCAEWKGQLLTFRGLQDAAAEEVATAKEMLQQAQRPLTEQEREVRRLAEQDPRTRPDDFVRARRESGWERRLRATEQAYRAATAKLTEATRQAQLREEFIRDRFAVAQAAARRCQELAMRRIATYQQQLVRTHRQGADLNLLLMTHPVGPELPGWVREPNRDGHGTEHSAVRLTQERLSDRRGSDGLYLNDETSSP